jgi:hypothetical protein
MIFSFFVTGRNFKCGVLFQKKTVMDPSPPGLLDTLRTPRSRLRRQLANLNEYKCGVYRSKIVGWTQTHVSPCEPCRVPLQPLPAVAFGPRSSPGRGWRGGAWSTSGQGCFERVREATTRHGRFPHTRTSGSPGSVSLGRLAGGALAQGFPQQCERSEEATPWPMHGSRIFRSASSSAWMGGTLLRPSRHSWRMPRTSRSGLAPPLVEC